MTTEWSIVSLGDVCELKYGKSLPKAKRSGAGFGVFGSNGEVGRHEKSLTTGTTIVVGRKGSFGEVAYSAEPCWPIDTTYYIDSTATAADLRWLYYRLKAMRLTELNRAAAIPGLNRDDAYAQQLLLPPIEEQRRIAAVLDAADELRAKRRQAVEMLDSLSDAVFIDLFGPVDDRAGNWVALSDLVSPEDKINYGVVQPGDHMPGGRPLIRVGDLEGGRVSHAAIKRIDPAVEAKYSRSRLRGDEILVSCVGSTGVVSLATEAEKGWNIARAVARVPLSPDVNRQYVAAFLRSPVAQRYFENELRTVSQPTLNIKQIKETPIRLPDRREQEKLAQRLAAIESLRERLDVTMAKEEELFGSLQQRAFRGEL